MMVDRSCYVIVGAGQTGAWAARTLRQEGFDGRLVMIGAERHPPYERPPLSKELLAGEVQPDSTQIFRPEHYDAWGVELRLGTRATDLDPSAGRVTLDDGSSLRYDRLLLATGGDARRIALPGASLSGIFYLRSIDDSLAFATEIGPSRPILMVGGGWLGLEAASTARKRGAEVTVAEYGPRLCGVAPPWISDALEAVHRDHGVNILLNARITAFEGAGRVERVRFGTGEALDVSAVLVSIGLTPATDLARRAGLALGDGILVDERWQTSAPNVFAAGDVASFLAPSGERKRIESWDNAQKQGVAAALGMLGRTAEAERHPWFWSDQFGHNIQILGECMHVDRMLTFGSEDGPRMAAYLRGDRVVGAAGIDTGRDIRAVKRLLAGNGPADAQALRTLKLSISESAPS